ncbi:Importin-11 [Galdieria sulphuraria]|uniref:Importin 11-like protein isoform 1 n=1 Tax=Galdieria sulphuraria TaxID=130081 RepID=M2VU22_GALSU|nr:Importin 11-like protein isoform 1 [Galdieria sulphuraria]EME26696.1 Importin 11-like protein isoform 1 [Galdieria sulphuraria]GJD05557.1 Importin-11 [Galdieria sulphuraria]|eukprot:XP_005703216.1 Importin 11-like protein isoform 1 [Galdieria sulphuraria]
MELQLSRLLTQALEPDNSIRSAAEGEISIAEQRTGFLSSLLNIIADKEHSPLNVRWLAAVVAKNSIDRIWRNTTLQLVSNEEKIFVRQRILSLLLQQDQLVATQLYLLLGRLARLDYPKDWPAIFESVLSLLESDETDWKREKLLQALYEVVKGVESKKVDPYLFHQASVSIIQMMFHLLQKHLSISADISLCTYIENLSQVEFHSVELCLKILRRVVHRDSLVMDLQKSLEDFIEWSLQNRCLFYYNGQDFGRAQRVSYLLCKFLLESQKTHPLLFCHVLSPLFAEYRQQWSNSSDEDWEQKTLSQWSLDAKALDIFHQVMECNAIFTSRSFEYTEENGRLPCELHGMHYIITDWSLEELEKGRRQVLHCFTESLVSSILELIIRRFLPCSKERLAKLLQEPTEYAMEEEAAEFDVYDPQTVAQAVCMSLLSHFMEPCLSIIMKLWNYSSDRDVVMLDVIYRILGAAVFDIFDRIDYEQWIELLSKIFSQTALQNILLRRRACLFGAQVGSFLHSEQQVVLFEQLLQIYLKESNIAVSWPALQAVEILLSSQEESSALFFSIEQTVLGLMQKSFQLLQQATHLSLKCDILDALTRIVEHLTPSVGEKLYQSLSNCIIELWNQSSLISEQDEAFAIRVRIVELIQSFIVAFYQFQNSEQVSVTFETFLKQLISWCVQLEWRGDGEQHEQLVEQGFHLWNCFLQCQTQYTQSVQELIPILISLAQHTTEYVGHYVLLIRNYIQLGGRYFIVSYGNWLCSFSYSLLEIMRDRVVIQVAGIVDSVILFHSEDWSLWIPIIRTMISLVLNQKESKAVEATFLAIISRAIWMDISRFEREVLGEDSHRLYQLVYCIVEKAENVYLPQDRKQIGLCLCRLATQRSIFLHVSLDAVVDIWLQCLSSYSRSQYDDEDIPSFRKLYDPMYQQDITSEIRTTVRQLEQIFTTLYPSMSPFWNALDRNIAHTFRSALLENN